MAATSTYMTFLMKGTGTDSVTYTKLVDIKEFPDLGGEPEKLETTTLSDRMQTYINGVQSLESMTFTANYDKDAYQTIYALRGQQVPYAVWFGGTESGSEVIPTGSLGKFSFTGEIDVFVSGGGVNEVRNMSMTIAPSTVITASFS